MNRKNSFSILFLILISACAIQADESWNIELLRRTACPQNYHYLNPFVWDAAANTVLYGDTLILERLELDEDYLYRPSGFLKWDENRLMSVNMDDQIAVVGLANGVSSIDLSEADQIGIIGELRDNRTHRRIRLAEQLAVSISTESPDVMCGDIALFDFSDPAEIRALGEIEGDFFNIAVGNNMIAVADSAHGVQLYSIADPEDPHLLGEVLEMIPEDLAFAGDMLAIGVRRTGLFIFDCSDPENPALRTTLLDDWNEEDRTGWDHFGGITGHGNRLVVTGSRRGGFPLILYDLSDADTVVIVSSVAFSHLRIFPGYRDALRFDSENIFAYGPFDGIPYCIYKLELDDENNITVTARYVPPFGARDMFIRGERLFLFEESRLHPINISEPERFRSSEYSFMWGFGLYFDLIDYAIGDDWLVLAELSQEGCGGTFHVFSLNDQGEPELIDPLRINGNGGLFAVEGFVGCETRRGWIIFDMDNPEEPVLVDTLDLPLSMNSVYSDNFLYSHSDNILRVFEVDEVPEFEQVAELEVDGQKLALNGEMLYSLGDEGITIINIAEPNEPEVIELYEIEGGVLDLAFTGNFGYGVINDGVTAIDFSDPDNPEEVGYYHDPGTVRRYRWAGLRSAVIKDDILYLSGGFAWEDPMGLFTFRIENYSKADEYKPGIPDRVTLLSNYPNPFNAQTTVKFNLEYPGTINIRLFTPTGRKLQDIISGGYFTTGQHSLLLPLNNLPSGCYILCLSTNSESLIRKITLLR